MIEYELLSLDKDKNEKQYPNFEESIKADDIERKKIFQYSTGKKYKLSFEDNSFAYPTKINISKSTVEFTTPELTLFSCSCEDFILNELNYCEHVAVLQRLFKYYNKEPFVQALIKHNKIQKEKSSLKTFIHYDYCKEQFVVSGKNHKEETLLLLKDFTKEHKKLLLESLEFLEAYVTSAGISKLESEIKVEKLDKVNKFYYEKENLLKTDIMNKLKDLVPGISLFDYQKDIFIDCLAAKKSIVALPPGGGKTLTSIALFKYMHDLNKDFTMFVIVPNTLKQQWVKEIKRFTGLDAVILGSQKEIKEWDGKQIAVINYHMMTRYIDNLIGEGKKTRKIANMLIVDELQTVKNSETKTWKAIKRLSSDFFLGLSGTIIENRLDDLYNTMQVVDENILGPKWKFDRDFQRVIAATKHKITYNGIKNIALLHKKIQHCVFSISEEELRKKLPPLTETTVYIKLSPEQQEIEKNYRAMADTLLKKGMERPLRPHEQILLNAYLLKARQACTASELLDKTQKNYLEPKIEEIKKIIENHCIAKNEKIVLFSEWTEMLGIVERMIKTQFKTVDYVIYSGDVPTKQRPKLVEKFKSDPNTKIFLSSDAGGTGLDGLQLVSNVIIHTEIPWNPAKIDQRNARLHRTLQTKPVFCYYIVADSGTEFKMQDKIMQKREIRKLALNIDRSEEQTILKISELKDILEEINE
jgi:SNF2 family DNA or RNA helicase